jgi:hypothetical protein
MDRKRGGRWLQYSRVRFLTDAFASEGASVGSVGWIVEVYADAYEVEVVSDDGSSRFLGAVPDRHLVPVTE